jgi:NADPH-dependent 2,4-dienoyl-CoA reductase/sulfur reductase-like enzyme
MQPRLVVIGGDAAGMSAASQARRRRPDMQIVALEKGRWTSYSACGIPYLVGGEAASVEQLVARSPQEFREGHRIDVRTEHEVKGIDLAAGSLEVRNLAHSRTYKLSFDLLHIATGAVPRRPPIPGIDLPHVLGVQTLEDAVVLLDRARSGAVTRVAVIGGSYIGLELAEAFVKRGAKVTLIERGPQLLPRLDPDMGVLVTEAARKEGIIVLVEEHVEGIEAGAVITAERVVPADLVILGVGVEPNSALAADAGITLGARRAIAVDRQQRTSAEAVWAAGDCCQSRFLVTGELVHAALGTVANKQGRVAGINMAGGYATFPGVAGAAVTKVCAMEIGHTGANEAQAEEAGFSYVAARVEGTTRAGYYPGAGPITVKLLVERASGRLLGGQVIGPEGAAKRIDVLTTAITARMTIDDLIGLDLAYAPPFATVWDPLQVAARQALRLLEGHD